MDRQALVTFLFKAPPEVRTVELLGSWDNFQTPYVMHHDRRRGCGFWSGCFEFQRIVFDGDRADWSKPRSGGLKQGGTYWYFYRLDSLLEAFDDSRECTRECPLLPGQSLNVLDVPVEVEQPPSRRRSATMDAVGVLEEMRRTHTLHPEDKWAALEPPPVSKVHERCISDLALNGRLETKPHSLREATPVSPVSRGRSPGLEVPRQRTADDERSLRPRSAWSSHPSSRGGSSIFNAHVCDQRDADVASLSASPMPVACGAEARTMTRDGGRAYHGFDSAHETGSSRHSLSRTGDDDLDGSSFILEPADSPPLSAYGSVDWRFTVPAGNNVENDTSADGRQYRHSEDSSHTDAEEEDDSITSPTFSAATISSEGGGVNTPFRLSGGYPPQNPHHTASAAPSHEPLNHNSPDASVEDITARLQHLASEDSAGSLPSHTSTNSTSFPERPIIGHYALSVLHEDGTASATTILSKASSTGPATISHEQDAMGSLRLGGGEAPSFADSIFNELGYLGGSIA